MSSEVIAEPEVFAVPPSECMGVVESLCIDESCLPIIVFCSDPENRPCRCVEPRPEAFILLSELSSLALLSEHGERCTWAYLRSALKKQFCDVTLMFSSSHSVLCEVVECLEQPISLRPPPNR